MKKKKIGFLTKNKARGHTYIYLRKSKQVRENGKEYIKKTNLFSFGKMPQALNLMYEWEQNPELFPQELKEQGYDLADLREWILTLETKVTSTGKKFEI